MSNRFTEIAERGLNNSIVIAEQFGHSYIGSEHILLSISKEKGGSAYAVLQKNSIDSKKIELAINDYSGTGVPSPLTPKDMTPKARKLIENAYKISLRYNCAKVGTEHILLAILEEKNNVACKLLINLGIDITDATNDIFEIIHSTEHMIEAKKPRKDKDGMLETYGRNMTSLARNGKIEAVIGRDKETDRLIRILSRKVKNNPCLIGEAGVGKTAIVEGLAYRIAKGNVPEILKGKNIISIDLTAMISGAKYRGDFEERIKGMISEAARDKSVILFIDEIHTIVGAGAAEGAIDASNILKPQLSRADIQLIGATTYSEYKKYIERDDALDRRFQQVKVEEPSIEEAVEILNGIKEHYERHHNVIITDSAIRAAVKLSVRYIPGRRLPDKAIDVMDETAAKISTSRTKSRITNNNSEQNCDNILSSFTSYVEDFSQREEKNIVSEKEITELVSEITGIPIKDANSKNSYRIIESLSKKIVGQKKAIEEVVLSVCRNEIGLSNEGRPKCTFLFVGSSGVGKTLLAKELTKELLFDEKKLIRYDMTEFSEASSISKIIGSPPGYVGYQESGTLIDKVRINPYSVILFDEIDKTHPDVINLLLQLIDEGTLTDSSGRSANFCNCYIIMTSNVPANFNIKTSGFLNSNGSKNDVLKEKFSNEFLSRIDEIIFFNDLDTEALKEILNQKITSLRAKLSNLDIEISVGDDVIEHIARKTLKEKSGARGAFRNMKLLIENEVSKKIITNNPCKISVELISDRVCVKEEQMLEFNS